MSPPRLMDRMREQLRSRHYSRRTEQAYCLWVRRFIVFHGGRHPADMDEGEINEFLTHLAVDERVSASTQNQALSGILFLYRHVLGIEVGQLREVVRARKPKRLPVVMTRQEVRAVLERARRGRVADGVAAVRRGAAADGVSAAARARHRLRPQRDHRARRQGRQGPGDDAAAVAEDAAAQAPRAGARDPRARPGRRVGPRGAARGARAQVPERARRVALAVGVPAARSVARPARRASRGGTTCIRRCCSGP